MRARERENAAEEVDTCAESGRDAAARCSIFAGNNAGIASCERKYARKYNREVLQPGVVLDAGEYKMDYYWRAYSFDFELLCVRIRGKIHTAVSLSRFPSTHRATFAPHSMRHKNHSILETARRTADRA